MFAPLVSVAHSAELQDVADPRPTHPQIAVSLDHRRSVLEALYCKSAGILLGFRYGARRSVGRYAKSEFLVIRLRPWWSRAGLKVIAYFGLPPRTRSK